MNWLKSLFRVLFTIVMVLFNSEYFSGYLFSVTIALVAFVAYLMWQLHEVAVHRAEEHRSANTCS